MTVTVRWNGVAHVEECVESPDPALTVGEYAALIAEAHGIPGVDHELLTTDSIDEPGGEPYPPEASVDLLYGETVICRGVIAPPAAETEAPALRPLGRTVEHDEMSRAFPAARAAQLATVTHKRTRKAFDQGDLGSCTGNAMCGVLVTAPWKHSKLSERTALELYELATKLDNAPGEYPPDDTGSSGLAVCKAAKQKKYISAYHHAFGLQHALEALVLGPVIIGIDWYDSFDTPGDDGLLEIAPDAQVRGGHEVELLGLDVELEQVIGINSWGPEWGDKGRFRMSWKTLEFLLANDGDVTVPVP